MRGLDTRIMLAQARIAAVIAGDDAGDEVVAGFIKAFECARLLGCHDGQVEVSVPPVLFRGEPDLLGWWQDGRESVAGLAEVGAFPGCDDSGADL
jgi:hypothetical protein